MALTPSHASSFPCFGEAGEEDSKAQQNFFQEMRGLVPTQSLITCVTLDKSLSCSEPQFFHLGNGGVGCYILGVTSPFQVL